jgi:hypothetical protein
MKNQLTPLYRLSLVLLLFLALTKRMYAQKEIIEMSYPTKSLHQIKTVGAFTYGYDGVGTIFKYNSSGDLISSYNQFSPNLLNSYIGGSTTNPSFFDIVGDDAYILGTTSSPNLIVTNGSALSSTVGGHTDMFLAKINMLTGAIVFATYFGGDDGTTSIEIPVSMKISGGNIYVACKMAGAYFPATNGTGYGGGNLDGGVAKFDGNTGAVIWASYVGGDGTDNLVDMEASGNSVHLTGTSTSSSATFVSTDGTICATTNNDIFYAKLNAGAGAKELLTFKGGAAAETVAGLKVDAGDAYIIGTTSSTNFPTTDGGWYKGMVDFIALKYDATGTLIYSTIIGGNRRELFNGNFGILSLLQVQNGCLYFAGASDYTGGAGANTYPKISGFQSPDESDLNYIQEDAVINKISPTGTLLFTCRIGGKGREQPRKLVINCNELYLLCNIRNFQFPGFVPGGFDVTNNTLPGRNDGDYGEFDVAVAKFNADNGQLLFGSYYCSPHRDVAQDIEVLGNGRVHFSSSRPFVQPGGLQNYEYPYTTNTIAETGSRLTRINTCPAGFISNTAVTPSTQTKCKNGISDQIIMEEAIIPGTAMPTIYRKGVPNAQPDIVASLYRWQEATAAAGPWTTISGANAKNYTPTIGLIDKYYRRQVISVCCGTDTTLGQTGDVASVLVSNDTAPVVNAGGTLSSCAGTPVTLGGSPTAIGVGGATITGYLWSPGGSILANPVVVPATTTIYNAVVTDNNGCQQLAQAMVSLYAANAGNDTTTCAGTQVQIGSPAIAGVPGVTYSWTASPADPGMSCTNCAQPLVNPVVPTTYTLTLTIPVTGGGTCATLDAVIVSPIAAPVGAFGGPDVIICKGSAATLGTPAQGGFTYTWSPGSYLSANNIAQPTFQPGSFNFPVPNPVTYFVTALNGGCVFTDEVKAYVINADAGIDGCGPRLIGTPDLTPDINETYSWTKITIGAGTSDFLGATNLPQVPVSGCTVPTTFRLTVTYGATVCTDDVIVEPCSCSAFISVQAPHTCASYTLNNGTVTLTGSAPFAATFTWSTTGGVTLSAYVGTSVILTNNASGTVTVTATSVYDPSVICMYSIPVNNPLWSLPVFNAQNVTTCASLPVNIGEPNVVGYSYAWTSPPLGPAGLNDYTISNPAATTNSTNYYPVLVTDIGSGCTIIDTAIVTIALPVIGIGGPDITLCGTATVQLGSLPLPGVTYLWTPAAGYVPNNTVANPTVNVGATTTFNVVATHTASGCVASDDVTVTTGLPVPPFSFPNQSFCPSAGGTMPLPAGPVGMASYSWSSNINVINPTSNGPIATTLNPRPLTSTTYTLRVTNASGCSGEASVLFIPQIDPPIASDKIVCLNGGAVPIGSAGNPTGPGITYSWSPATGLSDPTSPNPTFTPSAVSTTTYTLTKNEGGCTSSVPIQITVQDFILPAISSPAPICQNASVQIGTAPVAGVSYSWSPTAGLSNPNISNPFASPAATTTYTLTAVSANGCSATATVVVNVSLVPAPVITLDDIDACLGGANPILNPVISPAGTYQYNWTPNNGTLSNVNVANPSVNLFGAGTQTYFLTVTNTINGCANTADVNVNAGLCVSLGDRVWYDVNVDGLQEAGENGVQGVTVRLYNSVGAVIATTVTDVNGNYLFDNIYPGYYSLGFTTLPSSYTLTTFTNTSKLNALNSDANPGTGRTTSFILINGEDQRNLDAGITIGILPARLEFTAQKQGSSAKLSWKVHYEENVAIYVPEHSTDGRNYTAISSFNRNGSYLYNFTDIQPANDINFYRIKIVDIDGRISYSEVRVLYFGQINKVLVFPNPANEMISILLPEEWQNHMIRLDIFNQAGQSVINKTINQRSNLETININNLINGVYYIRLQNTNGAFEVKKIQVIR